jgi:ABC-type transporter Mla MlaB component
MKHRIDERENGLRLALSGELTINHASEIRDAFLALMASDRGAEIDLSQATAIDISCLQLLCSLHRTAVAKGLAVCLERGLPEDLVEVMRTAGYIREKGCSFDTPGTCLWKGVAS